MNKIKSFIEKVKRFLVIILTKIQTNKILLLKYIVFSGVLFLASFLGYLLYLFNDLPNVESLSQPQKRQQIVLLDNKDEILSVYGDMHSNYMHYYEIPRNLINAVVATEDRKFFQHFGIDIMGIFRAAVTNFQAGRTVQGGSTISQQLAKISFLSSERTLNRKLKEALLALEIENRYSKQEIMEIYLNKVYLGSGIFGVSAAAKYYFAKNTQDLNLYECAILAGLLKSPSRFSPKNNRDLSGNRAYQILINMHDSGFINKAQLDNAKNKSVILNTKLLGSVKKDFFTNHIYEQMFRHINPKEISNITIKTTFDTYIQNIATQELKRQARTLKLSRNGSEGAIIIMDHQGNILSMVGGVDFYKSSFNRAINAYRPTGSIFKTIVYTAAIEKGFLPTDIVEDKELQYGEWSPQNFNRTFLGEINIEEAFRKSLNTIPVQLMQKIGINNVLRTARKLGIKSKIDHNLSASLGSSSANLIEMTTAYAIIANNGLEVTTKSIESIKNNLNEQVLYKPKVRNRKRVISEDTTEHMKMLLRRAVVDGSARRALSSFKISGKTGTSQDYRDAWFVGYTDQYVIGVWLGNDDFSPMKYVTGGTFPTVIARNILRKITH
jgi:penicillin-binding protein 1A